MRLTDGLRLEPGRIAAFVGAGGKTSAIRRLVSEVAGAWPLLITTTTKFAQAQSGLAPEQIVLEAGASLEGVRERLAGGGALLVTGPLSVHEAKWTAPPGGTLQMLLAMVRELGGVALIEADGARGRSLKVPATHEPVIPEGADLVVPLAALDALGRPLDGEVVHRPEAAARLLGEGPGAEITPERMAALLSHPKGGLKGVPEGAEVRVLLNKVRSSGAGEAGRTVAEALCVGPRVQAALLAEAQEKDPVEMAIGRVAGVVLAAGGARRFGRPKAALELEGRSLLKRAVEAAIEGGLTPIVVVLGAGAGELRRLLEAYAVRVVKNPDWDAGMSTSVRAGLAAVEGEAEGVVFLLADMPLVDGALVRALVETHRRSLAPIVAPRAGGRWGNPALFDRATFPSLDGIRGDQGGRALFGRFPIEAVPWGRAALMDVDTEDDWRRLESGR